MKQVLILLAPGFQQTEALNTYDVLRFAEMKVHFISTSHDLEVQGNHELKIPCETTLSKLLSDNGSSHEIAKADALVIPGGGLGVQNLLNNKEVLQLVRTFREQDKWVAAICAGPEVVAASNGFQGARVTSYPSPDVKQFLISSGLKPVYDQPVVIDDNFKLVTSKNPSTAILFGLAILKVLDCQVVDRIQQNLFRNDFS